MSKNYNLPALSNEGSLGHYLQQIKKFPMLTEKQEINLAKKWRDEGDTSAAHALVTSHLRLVARIAMGYRGYGLPVTELISEGNIGLMQAVKKYDPKDYWHLRWFNCLRKLLSVRSNRSSKRKPKNSVSILAMQTFQPANHTSNLSRSSL